MGASDEQTEVQITGVVEKKRKVLVELTREESKG